MAVLTNIKETVTLRREHSEPRRAAVARAEHASFEARKCAHLRMTTEFWAPTLQDS